MAVHVAAIDFGTTYSGYAFSVSHMKTKLKDVQILANQAWNAGIREAISLKTPTCLLLNEEKEIVSFGYEAENEYSDIVMDGRQNDYYYFYRFKMSLHENEQIHTEMILKDVTGKTLPGLEVFSLAIKALIDHLRKTLEVKNVVLNEETNWLITVPAVWSDSAKMFMRKAAEMAGILKDNLTLALEPEAASIYCQAIPPPAAHEILASGYRYMVVDLGGGTVDITVHEKLPDGTLKELCKASGNDCGGTSIDNRLIQVFVDIFGQTVMDRLKHEHPDSYLDLIRRFENVKRNIHPEKKELVNISIPNIALHKLCENELGKTLEEVVKSSTLSDRIKLMRDKIRMDTPYVLSLFETTVNGILSLIEAVFSSPQLYNIPCILLVGGFGECLVVQQAIKREYPDKAVIVPEEASLAVLKGAVLFRYQLNLISSRITRCSYGVEIVRPFTETDDRKRLVYKNLLPYCEKVFHCFMKANTSIPVGMKVRQTYSTSDEFQSAHKLPVFYTYTENVEYTDDSKCVKLGELYVDIPDPSKHLREVYVTFHFGETELNVDAIDKESGKECNATFILNDFL